jgi:hypothetical protein
MLERTKKRLTEEMVTIHLRVHRSNADRIKRFAESIDADKPSESRPWREVLSELRPDDTFPAAILRGSRVKEEMTQVQLSEITGIPRRHISEMETGKRPIGKESAKKLGKALSCDYRVFL